MESGASGTGKSRVANGEACHLAIPEYYNVVQKKWVRTNLSESVLVISTELEESECQQMWMAYVSGVNESHIKDGRYFDDEEERVDKAIDLIEKSNLYFVSITNYYIDDITNIIKKYKQLHNVNYVYFDYLGETLKITSGAAKQAKVQGLRTDQILLMFASALKDVAKTLGIYIWTASQLSGDYKNAKELDAGYLRSAKSIADKVDVGAILMPVREQDQNPIASYCGKGFEIAPNFVLTVYKVRAGSFQNIKVYIYFDRGTCQIHDCFVTDANGAILTVADTNIEIMLDQTKEENFEVAYTGKKTEEAEPEFSFDF
jgi:replicative DNA helicase